MQKRSLVAFLLSVFLLVFARQARALPEAHILRIDPRAGVSEGQPTLTSVVELVQFTPMSELVTNAGCNSQKGDALLDCISGAVEAKNALWKAIAFNEANARLLVRVDGSDSPAKFVSKNTWGASAKEPLVGTAWLIALDASSSMGPRYADARFVADQFIRSLGPNDVAKLIIFDDRVNAYTASSPWVAANQQAQLVTILNANPTNAPSHQRGRPFFNQIKSITQAFADLGNAGGGLQKIPMHQAMVVLSNGAGREDVGSGAPGAEVLKQFFNKGRFPEDNPAAPKTPLPVISVYFPAARGAVNDLYASNDMQFMQDLSNPEIGGFFDIVRSGQGASKAATILALVKARFNAMWVVKWRVSCLAPTVEQSFNLVFQNTNPAVKPDGSFKDVPIGADPTSWPLDINLAQTKAEADANPVHPGGTFRVYGDFCWGGDKQRAEAYFVPAGTKPDQNVNRSDPDVAKKAMQNLIAQNMRGGAVEASDTFVTLNVPDEEKILEGTGDNTVAHVVVYDNKAHRASGITAETVLTLKAGKKPLNLPIILGGAGLIVVILLLVIVLMRGGGGGGKGKRAQQPPPAPVVAGGPPPYGGGGYGGGGAPPYGGGGYQPPPGGGYGGGGGGYGAAGLADDPAATAPAHGGSAAVAGPSGRPPQPMPPPYPGRGADPLALAGGAPIEVRCPACNMLTMATPGQSSVCFSCGQPLPRNLAAAPVAASGAPGVFPLTAGLAQAPEPPPNPYGATGATIVGAAGKFAIRAGVEVCVGRDPARCPIVLGELRVSAVHATLKFESGILYVRDEGSNNGTYLNGGRIPNGAWTPAPPGGPLRFGPVEFTVRIE